MRPTDQDGRNSPASWQGAEALAVTHLRSLGFGDARLTPPGADSGADVVGTGVVAQVKHWARPVGAPPVRDLHGVATARRAVGVFYSAAGYTPPAIKWAIEADVALFVYSGGSIEPWSPGAWRLVESGAGPGARRLGWMARSRADANDAKIRKVVIDLEVALERAKRLALTGRSRQQMRAATAIRTLTRVRRLLNEAQTMDPADRAWSGVISSAQKAIKTTLRSL